MIKASENFYFNGSYASDFGIINVNVNTTDDMLQEPFFSNRTLNKTKLKYKGNAYFQNIQTDVKQIELQLAFSDETIVTNSLKRAVQRWLLDTTGYKELWFEQDCQLKVNDEGYDLSKPKRIYMATVINSSMFNHFNLPAGYFNVTFETNSNVCYSLEKGNNPYEVGEAEIDENEEKESKVYFFNHGDFEIKPQIKIQVKPVGGVDINNHGIKIIGEAIDDPTLGGNSELNDGFNRTYNVPQTNYANFLPFEFLNGQFAKGFFQLLGTTYYGEKILIGNKTYEFDLGYGKCYNKLESNILVPVTAPKASNVLTFNKGSFINDGSTVSIGEQCFEFDFNNLYSSTSIPVDISDYVGKAKGILYLNSNLMPNIKIRIGDITYTMVSGTNDLVIKMTNHLLADNSELNYFVNTDKTTLVSDNVNISTKKTRDISQCLLRNMTRNTSDLGIRRIKYLNKDFVMCLWDGESGEDYQQMVNDVPTNGRLIITFDDQVDEKTINDDTIQCRNMEGNQIQLSFDISKDKKVIGVTPKTNYDEDTDYYLYVSKGVKNLKCRSFNQVKKIKFHTKKDGDTTVSDTYNNVSAVKVFSMYSSRKINSSTAIDNNIYVTKSGSNSHEEVNINILNGGTAISVSPKTRYEYGSNYTLHIGTGLKDIDGNSILSTEKIINFSIQTQTNETVVTDEYEVITNAFVDKALSIPFSNKLSTDYLNTNTVVLEDERGTRIPIYVERSLNTPNILLVTPQNTLLYNTTYYLYVSGAISYYNGNNIESPRKFKVITMTEDYAKNYNSPSTNVEVSIPEIGNLNLLHNDYTLVNTDKTIVYDFDKTLDESTINSNNIYILDGKGNKFTDFTAQIGLAGEGIKIFPNTVWDADSSYSIYITPNVKITDKPRVFVADAPEDLLGKGDYENALEIFGKLGFEVIKTNDTANNPYTVQGSDIIDSNSNIIKFKNTDIVVGDDTSYKPTDFDANKNVKNGTVVITIPRSIMTYDAPRIFGQDRVETKSKMLEYSNKIKNNAWVTQQLYTEDTKVLTFTTKLNNEKISIDLDGSISLKDNTLLINEIPKKIVGQTAGDSINLYEDRLDKMDFTIDMNMLIPNKIPQGAKAYAGRASDGDTNPNKDDFNNAKDILEPLGYEIIDTTPMTFAQKYALPFHDGDLVIGGELAGSKSSDFDANGNLKTSKPGTDSTDDKNDTRLERIAGIPHGVSIYPARRLQGSGDNQGRLGTKKAMQDWKSLIEQANDGKTLTEGYITDGVLNGVAVKYNVPKDAYVYGTGADFINGLKYLGDMGYKFVNVGLMTLADKMSLPFKEGDLVLGDIGASDIVASSTSGSTSTTVTGVPAINIGKARRLGGADRFETEKIIKAFAESLKPRGVEAGDIVKLKINIDNPKNDTIIKTNSPNGDEGSQMGTSSGIDENTRIEYHMVKSIKQLSRNRVFIEFEEDIRTIHYIKEIQITDLYKLYETRTAEDYLFNGAYQIRIGDDKNKTMIDIVRAINNTGTFGIEYSQYTFKHPMVLAQIANADEIELDALDYGSKYNIPVSLVDKIDPKNRFLTTNLEGGKDCTQDDAIKALAKTILEQNDKKDRYNKDQYDVTYTTTTLTITHKMCGDKYNDIPCLANVTESTQTPYLITNTGTDANNASLINNNDFLTREKQVAKWDKDTLVGGKDPTVEDCILVLMEKITNNQPEVKVSYLKDSNNQDDKTGFNIQYATVGEVGNIVLNTTCVNAKISGKKLSGGLDGLQVSETIIMDCENEIIKSSTGKDRYKNFNGNWLSIPLDGVMLRVKKGNFTITFAYKEKYYI